MMVFGTHPGDFAYKATAECLKMFGMIRPKGLCTSMYTMELTPPKPEFIDVFGRCEPFIVRGDDPHRGKITIEFTVNSWATSKQRLQQIDDFCREQKQRNAKR